MTGGILYNVGIGWMLDPLCYQKNILSESDFGLDGCYQQGK